LKKANLANFIVAPFTIFLLVSGIIGCNFVIWIAFILWVVVWLCTIVMYVKRQSLI
jgi:hypothetical protein